MISNRTKISISQFLSIMDRQTQDDLSNKHRDNTYDLVREIISTSGALVHTATNELKYEKFESKKVAFYERFNDLEKCLLLDGYKVEVKNYFNTLIKIEPTVDGVIAFEDDLINEIRKTNLVQKMAIIQIIKDSAICFKDGNYNNCLSNARIALETIVRDEVCGAENPQKWGKALSQLKDNKVLTEKDEKMIANTYTFISKGSHIPLGFTEEEYTRYARNLCMSMCYFLVKKINANSNDTDTIHDIFKT